MTILSQLNMINSLISKKMKKVTLIFGITGQDGSYLAELLLKKLYSSWVKAFF